MIDFVRCAFRVSIRKACRALPAYRTTYPLPVSPTRASISVRKCIREIAVKRHPELTPALPHQKCYRRMARHRWATAAESGRWRHGGEDQHALVSRDLET